MKGILKGSSKRGLVIGLTLFALIGVVLVSTVAMTTAQEEKAAAPVTAALPPKATPEDLEAGKAVYFRKCVWCHGPEGAGDGPGADRLWPRPRNFNQGTFKVRLTGSGELPRSKTCSRP
jgi:cytochrome c5